MPHKNPEFASRWLTTCVFLRAGGSSGLKGQPLDGVSAWGAIARGEPSKRTEIVHDIWYTKDPEGGNSKTLRWAALHMGHMKLLQGSGAYSWELYNVTADVGEANDLFNHSAVAVEQGDFNLFLLHACRRPRGASHSPARHRRTSCAVATSSRRTASQLIGRLRLCGSAALLARMAYWTGESSAGARTSVSHSCVHSCIAPHRKPLIIRCDDAMPLMSTLCPVFSPNSPRGFFAKFTC